MTLGSAKTIQNTKTTPGEKVEILRIMTDGHSEKTAFGFFDNENEAREMLWGMGFSEDRNRIFRCQEGVEGKKNTCFGYKIIVHALA